MDTAGQLLILEFEEKSQINRQLVYIPDIDLVKKVEFIKSHSLDLLICGAVSRQLLQFLTMSGIQVIPFIRGSIKKVLSAYINDALGEDSFFLPGCKACRRKQYRRRGQF
jgi:predicted Fe-Mo cluster-binding NifX family protein